MGSRKQSCGDNIYFRDTPTGPWQQRDSFHSSDDGAMHPKHVARDTSVNRVLISNDFVYFGGTGPTFPDALIDKDGRQICKRGIGRSSFGDPALLHSMEKWLHGLGSTGYQGPPQEWLTLRDAAHA